MYEMFPEDPTEFPESGIRFEVLDEKCCKCGTELRAITWLFEDDRPLEDCLTITCIICDGYRKSARTFLSRDPDALADDDFLEAMDYFLGPRREWLGPVLN